MARPKTPFAQLLAPVRKQLSPRTPLPQPKSTVQIKLEDERLYFVNAMQGVQPLAQAASHQSKPRPPSPWPRPKSAAQASVDLAISDHWPWPELAQQQDWLFLRPGQKHDTLRRLKRGHWPVGAELDLHGHDSDSARTRVAQFVQACQGRKVRCARIIHGKGLSSKDQTPVLKQKLGNWLVQTGAVLAFCQAPAHAGGGGAVLLLIKSGKLS